MGLASSYLLHLTEVPIQVGVGITGAGETVAPIKLLQAVWKSFSRSIPHLTAQPAARAHRPRLPHQAHGRGRHGMEQLSEYEQERARRILANQTRLGAPVLLHKLTDKAK